MNDTQTLYQICDDTLVGITAINPRKFAEEFSRQRRMGTAFGQKSSNSGVKSNGGGCDLSSFDTGNRFVTVGGKKKKNK